MGKVVHWVSKMPTSQLLVWCCVILKTKSHLTFLPSQVVGQQFASVSYTMLWALITSTCEMLELNDWEPNKLQAQLLFLKKNPTSKVVFFFWVKLVPYLMGHIVGTKRLNNYIFSHYPIDIMVQIIRTKLMHMVLQWSVINYTQNPK